MSQSFVKHTAIELMKLSEYQRSLTLVKVTQNFKVKTCFSQKQLSDLEPKFI